jgi:hypothetical protein
MRGDVLARGAASATFPSSSHVPQAKWDAAFADVKATVKKKKEKKKV